MNEDEELAEIARLRAASRARLAELSARHPLPDLDAWSHRADEEARRGEVSWSVVFEMRFHPLGDELTGLMIVRPPPAPAHVWWARRSGLSAVPEASVTVDAGDFLLDERATTSLRNACRVAWERGLADVPSHCYDGTPATLVLRRAGEPEAQRASLNLADTMVHPTASLARAVLRSLRQADPARRLSSR